MERLQVLTIRRASECRWTTDRVYALRKSYLPQIEHCNYEAEVLATYPNWVVLKLRESGEGSHNPPFAFSTEQSPLDHDAQILSLVYQGVNGASDVVSLLALIGPRLEGAGSCDLQIDPVHGYVFLLTDAGTSWKGAVTMGATGTVQNSQCAISGVDSSVAAEGNKVIVRLALTFKPFFTGPKTLFANAIRPHGLDTGWKNLGAWSAPAPP
jgi:hypothetical protein